MNRLSVVAFAFRQTFVRSIPALQRFLRPLLAGSSLLVLMVVSSCSSSTSPSATSSLRVTNTGPAAVRQLVLLFPDAEVSFGDVNVGTTTSYQNVPNGVFRYAAYRFAVDGVTITQPVIDWVGEKPLDGKAFTYVIDVEPARLPVIRVVGVNRDR